jgi:NTE family protein
MPEIPTTGLILTGGGARAAYQVGVLDAVANIRRHSDAPPDNPFPVIAGTSAGAINAAALACHCDDFDAAVGGAGPSLAALPCRAGLPADSIGVIRTGARWLTMMSIGWMIARWRRARPRSLLDNSPLRRAAGQADRRAAPAAG